MNHAYLRLPKILVSKDRVGDLLDKYDRIETCKQINNLKDQSKIRVVPFVYISFGDFSTIMGSCEKHKNNQKPILTGVVGTKHTGKIGYKTILKLIQAEKELGINLSISEDIKNKIKNYT